MRRHGTTLCGRGLAWGAVLALGGWIAGCEAPPAEEGQLAVAPGVISLEDAATRQVTVVNLGTEEAPVNLARVAGEGFDYLWLGGETLAGGDSGVLEIWRAGETPAVGELAVGDRSVFITPEAAAGVAATDGSCGARFATTGLLLDGVGLDEGALYTVVNDGAGACVLMESSFVACGRTGVASTCTQAPAHYGLAVTVPYPRGAILRPGETWSIGVSFDPSVPADGVAAGRLSMLFEDQATGELLSTAPASGGANIYGGDFSDGPRRTGAGWRGPRDNCASCTEVPLTIRDSRLSGTWGTALSTADAPPLARGFAQCWYSSIDLILNTGRTTVMALLSMDTSIDQTDGAVARGGLAGVTACEGAQPGVWDEDEDAESVTVSFHDNPDDDELVDIVFEAVFPDGDVLVGEVTAVRPEPDARRTSD